MKTNHAYLVQCTNAVCERSELDKPIQNLVQSKANFGIAKVKDGYVLCREITIDDQDDSKFISDIYKNLKNLPYNEQYVETYENGKRC